jgi:hypothetical protein
MIISIRMGTTSHTGHIKKIEYCENYKQSIRTRTESVTWEASTTVVIKSLSWALMNLDFIPQVPTT